MGGLVSKKAKIIIIGLDNSGKTTILNKIKEPTKLNRQITPTVGYQMQQFSRNGIDFQVYDMSGEQRYRDLWVNYISKINGIIFVVDVSDQVRLGVSYSQLQMILEDKNLPYNLPILFYGNKADSKEAVQEKQIVKILHLNELKQKWHLINCCGLTGQGIQLGIQWLSEQIKESLETN